jgi:predicted SAM-dependent methyltransferase
MYRWAFYGKEYRAFVPQGIMPKDWYIHLFHAQFGIICFIDKCMAVYYRHDDSVWSGNVLLKHGIKHIKFFEAVWENIAVNKRLYFCLHVIPFVKQVYDVFKKNNYIDGLNFIENNSNWRNISMQKIYIWGAGHYGVLTALDYEQKGIEIKAFIDKNANEVKTRLGLPVLEFNEAMCNENKDFQIIIAVQNETAIKEIIEKLQSLGLKKNKDFCISPLISYFSEPPALALSSIQAILDSKAFIKLHLGCGPVYKDGWINIDNNSDNNIQKLDLNLDLRKSLPFPDNSVNFIYNEHFFEHLTVEEGILAIIDFYRVLKIGGVMRIAMPNLERTVNNYLDENWKENLKEHFKKFGLTFIQTRAELINIGFRWWGHKWLYDWEELERRLKEAGCKKIKRCAIFESEHEELKNLETRNESTLIAEVMKI